MGEGRGPIGPERRVRSIRARIDAMMRARQRNLVVLAVDGLPVRLAKRHWATARIGTLRSEFPATSSTCWLSAVTGASPSRHGAVGYLQRFAPGARAKIVFSESCTAAFAATPTLFDDARAAGYRPVCLEGDFAHLAGAWRDRVTSGAEMQATGAFYSGRHGFPSAADVLARLHAAIDRALNHPGPTLLWCYVDVDLLVHKYGYDAQVTDLLDGIESLARSLTPSSDVVACSDHGLVPTAHDPDLETALQETAARFGAELAGAGRTRWFYAGEDRTEALRDRLIEILPGTVKVRRRADLFEDGPFAVRVGDPVIVATGDRFLAEPGYTHDHGSWLDDEVFVPFAHWSRQGD